MLRATVGVSRKISENYNSTGFSLNLDGEIQASLDDPETVIATVTAPTREIEPEVPEGEEGEALEGEEPAEGEAPEGESDADAAGDQGTVEG